MKLKQKPQQPLEMEVELADANFDSVKSWLHKTIGFVDINGDVHATYSLKVSVQQLTNEQIKSSEDKPT